MSIHGTFTQENKTIPSCHKTCLVQQNLLKGKEADWQLCCSDNFSYNLTDDLYKNSQTETLFETHKVSPKIHKSNLGSLYTLSRITSHCILKFAGKVYLKSWNLATMNCWMSTLQVRTCQSSSCRRKGLKLCFMYKPVEANPRPEIVPLIPQAFILFQRCSQDFHEGGAQLDGIVIVCGVAACGQLCWPQGVGAGRGICPLPPKAETFGIFSSTVINFY